MHTPTDMVDGRRSSGGNRWSSVHFPLQEKELSALLTASGDNRVCGISSLTSYSLSQIQVCLCLTETKAFPGMS